VRAAGGVVVRVDADVAEFLVVHRPKHDDWSWPKGHLEVGESDQDAALREVREETGLGVRCVTALSEVDYVVPSGDVKCVRYWLMALDGETHASDGEVDRLRWAQRDEASGLLSYEQDVAVLERAELALDQPDIRASFISRSPRDSPPGTPSP